MTLLVSEAIGIAEHALAGPIHEKITALRCVNEAGHWLCNARPWRWLRGGLEALPFVVDQPYVDLPANFGSITAIEGGRGFPSSIELTTLEELLLYKANAVGSNGTYYTAVVTYDHADITGTSTANNATVTATTAAATAAKKKPTARLEIYPTPDTAATDGILLYYTRGWSPVSQDQDTIFVPDWMESVYLRALRCWAKGYEEDDIYSKDDMLDRFISGSEYLAAIKRDSQAQIDLGVLRGGAAMEGQDRSRPSRYNGVIANP